MENKKSILSIRIKELRNEMNLTQEDLAKKLGLNNKSSIANYESGYSVPSDEIKSKMCEIFGCTMDYLMGESNFKNVNDAFEKFQETQYQKDIINAIRVTTPLFISAGLKVSDIKEIQHLFSTIFNPDQLAERLESLFNKFKNIDSTNLYKAMESLVNYLIDCINSRELYSNFTSLKNKFSQKHSLSNQYYMCPVYGQISAGQPNWAEENIEGRIPIDTDLMDIYNPEEYFFLRVNGESMNKVIKNGAFALIHKQETVENGEIAVVLVNGYDATLKKFIKQGDLIILEPNSTDESFETQVYDKTTSIKILGKYVGKLEINK